MLSTKTNRPQEAAVPRLSSATEADVAAAEAEVIRQGVDALGRIKNTFDAWLEVARALGIGRRHAMAEAGTDDTDDRGYRKAFGRWLAAHPPFDDTRILAKTTRLWLLRCYDHEAEIIAWRKDKPLELVRYHYPEQVFKRWARVCRPELLSAGDHRRAGATEPSQRRRDSQAAAIDDVVTKLEHVSDDLHRHMAGTQLTLDLSTPELVIESAQVVIDIYGAAYGDDKVLSFADRLIQLIAAKKRPAREPSARRVARGVAMTRSAEEG